MLLVLSSLHFYVICIPLNSSRLKVLRNGNTEFELQLRPFLSDVNVPGVMYNKWNNLGII